MKLNGCSSPKRGSFVVVLIVCIVLPILLTVSCKKKGEDTWSIIEDGIEGTWILKEAVFRNQIDLDGPGPMLPTTDAKTVLFDLMEVYNNCSSILDIPFSFTDEPPLGIADAWLFPFAHAAYAVCQEGFGITAWVFDYQFQSDNYPDYPPQIYVVKKDIKDPGNFWQNNNLEFFFVITGDDTSGGKYSISGRANADQMRSTYPDFNPDLTFDWVMERVDQ